MFKAFSTARVCDKCKRGVNKYTVAVGQLTPYLVVYAPVHGIQEIVKSGPIELDWRDNKGIRHSTTYRIKGLACYNYRFRHFIAMVIEHNGGTLSTVVWYDRIKNSGVAERLQGEDLNEALLSFEERDGNSVEIAVLERVAE